MKVEVEVEVEEKVVAMWRFSAVKVEVKVEVEAKVVAEREQPTTK